MAFNDIPNKSVGDTFSADEFNLIIAEIKLKQLLSNLVTSWSGSPTNAKYPSEKLVKDSLNDLSLQISNLSDEVELISGLKLGKIDTSTDLLDEFDSGVYVWDALDAGTPTVANNFPVNKQGNLFVIGGSSRLYFDEDGDIFSYNNIKEEWEQIVTKSLISAVPPTLSVPVPVVDVVASLFSGSTNTMGKVLIENTSVMARPTDGDYRIDIEFSEEIADVKTVQLTGGNNSSPNYFYVQDLLSTGFSIVMADTEIPDSTSIEVYYKIN